jgi:hypothetical protein
MYGFSLPFSIKKERRRNRKEPFSQKGKMVAPKLRVNERQSQDRQPCLTFLHPGTMGFCVAQHRSSGIRGGYKGTKGFLKGFIIEGLKCFLI